MSRSLTRIRQNLHIPRSTLVDSHQRKQWWSNSRLGVAKLRILAFCGMAGRSQSGRAFGDKRRVSLLSGLGRTRDPRRTSLRVRLGTWPPACQAWHWHWQWLRRSESPGAGTRTHPGPGLWQPHWVWDSELRFKFGSRITTVASNY